MKTCHTAGHEKTQAQPGKTDVLNQLCKYIPPYLVPHLAPRLVWMKGQDLQSWSHVVTLGYAH